jgi:hypothetical protein
MYLCLQMNAESLQLQRITFAPQALGAILLQHVKYVVYSICYIFL